MVYGRYKPTYNSGKLKVAIEHGHTNTWFTKKEKWLSIVVLVSTGQWDLMGFDGIDWELRVSDRMLIGLFFEIFMKHLEQLFSNFCAWTKTQPQREKFLTTHRYRASPWHVGPEKIRSKKRSGSHRSAGPAHGDVAAYCSRVWFCRMWTVLQFTEFRLFRCFQDVSQNRMWTQDVYPGCYN